MAVNFVEGFDAYNGTGNVTGTGSRWNIIPFNANIATATGRFGGQCITISPAQIQNGEYGVGRLLDTVNVPIQDNFTLGFAYQKGTGANDNNVSFIHLHSTLAGVSSYELGIRHNPADNSMSVILKSSQTAGTVLCTSAANVFALNQWHYIELEAFRHDTTGFVRLYINSVLVCSATNVDTRTAAGVINQLACRPCGTPGNPVNYYDDIYISDSSTRLGECRVETLRPTADTATKQWTPDTGAVNFSRVNATLAQSTTYVSSGTVGNTDLYELADLTGTPSSVFAVSFSVVANKTDANTKSIAFAYDDGTLAIGADQFLGSTAIMLASPLVANTKPSGGAWTAALVNALKLGQRVTT